MEWGCWRKSSLWRACRGNHLQARPRSRPRPVIHVLSCLDICGCLCVFGFERGRGHVGLHWRREEEGKGKEKNKWMGLTLQLIAASFFCSHFLWLVWIKPTLWSHFPLVDKKTGALWPSVHRDHQGLLSYLVFALDCIYVPSPLATHSFSSLEPTDLSHSRRYLIHA